MKGRDRRLGDLSFLREASTGHRSTLSTCLAGEEVLVGLSIFRAHDYVDDGVDASGQVDEHVACNVQSSQVHFFAQTLDDGDGHVAHDKGHEDDQNHLEKFSVLGRHPTRVAVLHRRTSHGRTPMEGFAHL